MGDSATAPVISGLAVGIGFVILFATLSDDVQPIVYSHYTTTIEGLKDSYSAGEPIDFVVRVTGFGNGCGYPDVSIKNADTGEIVWSPERFAFPLCDPAPHQHSVTWMPKDWGKYPIVIDKEGSYFVEAEFNEKVREDFVVMEDEDDNSVMDA
ncbi:MAG: hypothetical protein AB1351_07940 [Thermoproteota archaeon]